MQNNYYPFSTVPFIRLIVPFVLGIFFFRLFPYTQLQSILFVALFSIFILLIIIHILIKRTASINSLIIWGIALNFFLITIGYTLASYNYPSFKHYSSIVKNGLALGKIASNPQLKGKHYKVELEIKAIQHNKQWTLSKGKALVYMAIDEKSSKLNIGDEIVFIPKLNFISNKGNPKEFDYQQYLAFHFISQIGFLKSNDWLKISSDNTFSLIRMAERLRNKVLYELKSLQLPKDVYAIASAITLGYKNDIDAEIKQSYATAGATHILAVSGLHVGIVYLVLQYLLFFLKKNKWQMWLKLILILLSLWTYAFITGLSPSVLRAATMFSFLAIGKQINRQTNIYNILAASAFMLLCTNPFLLFDIGFQLSYIAVIGIVYFQPKIRNWVYLKNKILSFIWDLISVTIAAQLVTTPLSIYYFHQFPSYFLLSGIVLVPITSFVIYLTLLSLAFSIFPAISHIFTTGLKYLVIFMNQFTNFIEHLPFSSIQNIYINEIQLVLLYLLLISVTTFLLSKKIVYLKLNLIIIILFSISMLVHKIIVLNQKSIYVYNIKNCSILNFIDGRQNILFAQIPENKKKALDFSVKDHWLSMGLKAEKFIPFDKLNSQFLFSNLGLIDNPNLFFKRHFFNFYGYKLLVINDDYFFKNIFKHTIKVDAVILQQKAKVDLKKLLKFIHTKQIIIDSSCPQKKIDLWKKMINGTRIPTFIVKEQGAWRHQI
ncbi:MAG: ComEC/Rec2 family competence protein [Bacteroidales bacterium]